VSANRKSVLFLSQSLAYPPHTGVQSRTFNVIKQLQIGFDVHVIAFSRRNHHPDVASRTAARGGLVRHATSVFPPVEISSEFSRIRELYVHAKSGISRTPYTRFVYSSKEYRGYLRSALSDLKPDIVHLDSIDLSGYLDDLPDVPIVCTHHDIESALLRRKAEQIRNPIVRRYVAWQGALVERLERRLAGRLSLNVVMSATDATVLRERANSAPIAIVPNGVDTAYFRPAEEEPAQPNNLLFLGPTFMFANRDAVGYFLEAIWARTQELSPDVRLELVGRNSEADREHFSKYPRVGLVGYVPDVRPYLQRALCSIVPIRVGGGTRIKILESWACGVPVVSTSIGCEGLAAVDGENILIRDDPRDFAQAIAMLSDDEHLRRRIGRAGRRTVEQRYSWDAIGATMRDTYSALLTG
jgi:polysaccharide biosynthesis protein PslH